MHECGGDSGSLQVDYGLNQCPAPEFGLLVLRHRRAICDAHQALAQNDRVSARTSERCAGIDGNRSVSRRERARTLKPAAETRPWERAARTTTRASASARCDASGRASPVEGAPEPGTRAGDEDRLLASCYRRAPTVAAAHDVRSLAFPSISTGAYRFPLRRASAIAVETVRDALARQPTIDAVVFVCFGAEVHRLYEELLRG